MNTCACPFSTRKGAPMECLQPQPPHTRSRPLMKQSRPLRYLPKANGRPLRGETPDGTLAAFSNRKKGRRTKHASTYTLEKNSIWDHYLGPSPSLRVLATRNETICETLCLGKRTHRDSSETQGIVFHFHKRNATYVHLPFFK